MSSGPRIAVIGAGIVGLSIAARLSQAYRVTVVEQEIQPGYHSTGRSAAVFHKAFENDVVHRLSCWSESFFLNPPQGFSGIAEPLDHLMLEMDHEPGRVEEILDLWSSRCPWLYQMDSSAVRERVPSLRTTVRGGVMDEESLRIDVSNLLEGLRRQLLSNEGVVRTGFRVESIDRLSTTWSIGGANGTTIEAEILVNAAGAWANAVAVLAGLTGQDLSPKRRTAVLVDPGVDVSGWPMCYRTGIYFKPEAGGLLVSPADETDCEPCDAQPELLDVAITIERLNETLDVVVERPLQQWAGLRTFTSERTPLIGFDPSDEGFFWASGLGGFGIQTSPAYSEIAFKMLRRESVDETMGIDLATFCPRLDVQIPS